MIHIIQLVFKIIFNYLQIINNNNLSNDNNDHKIVL